MNTQKQCRQEQHSDNGPQGHQAVASAACNAHVNVCAQRKPRVACSKLQQAAGCKHYGIQQPYQRVLEMLGLLRAKMGAQTNFQARRKNLCRVQQGWASLAVAHRTRA